MCSYKLPPCKFCSTCSPRCQVGIPRPPPLPLPPPPPLPRPPCFLALTLPWLLGGTLFPFRALTSFPGFLRLYIFTPFRSDGRSYLMIFSPSTLPQLILQSSMSKRVGCRRMCVRAVGCNIPVLLAVITCDVQVC